MRPRFGIDMTQFPLIVAISDRLQVLEPFQAAHPTQQPDAVL